jgi:hypothetical protein
VQALLARLIVLLDVEKAAVTYEDGQVIAPAMGSGWTPYVARLDVKLITQ